MWRCDRAVLIGRKKKIPRVKNLSPGRQNFPVRKIALCSLKTDSGIATFAFMYEIIELCIGMLRKHKKNKINLTYLLSVKWKNRDNLFAIAIHLLWRNAYTSSLMAGGRERSRNSAEHWAVFFLFANFEYFYGATPRIAMRYTRKATNLERYESLNSKTLVGESRLE